MFFNESRERVVTQIVMKAVNDSDDDFTDEFLFCPFDDCNDCQPNSLYIPRFSGLIGLSDAMDFEF